MANKSFWCWCHHAALSGMFFGTVDPKIFVKASPSSSGLDPLFFLRWLLKSSSLIRQSNFLFSFKQAERERC